jgi:hypothetical protein
VAAGSDLIRYQQNCYGGYEYDQPHRQSHSRKARLEERAFLEVHTTLCPPGLVAFSEDKLRAGPCNMIGVKEDSLISWIFRSAHGPG